MKKIILFVFFCSTLLSYSQENKVNFGLKGGVNYAKFSADSPFIDFKRKIGFYAGGFTNIGINKKLKIQPEILYSSQGTKVVFEDIQVTDTNGEVTVGDYKSNFNESTISLPISLQYYFIENFYLEGGPQFGFILNRKEKVLETPFEDIDANDSTQLYNDNFDFGAIFGIGHKVTKNISINGRFFLGLIKRDNVVKSSVFYLGVDYNFL